MPTFVPFGTTSRHGIVHVRVEAEEAVERLVRLEAAATFAFVPGMSDFAFGIVEHLYAAAAEDLLDAVGTLLEARVARLVDDDEDLLRAGGLELLAGALAGDVLGLADVDHRRSAGCRTRRGPS